MVKKDKKDEKKQITRRKSVKKNVQKKLEDISGTWEIECKLLRIKNDNSPEKKLINYKSELIITHNKEDNDFVLLYRKIDSGNIFPLRPEGGYQPGIIKRQNLNKLNLIIADYDDNGVFNLLESKKENGEIKEFIGTYVEGGFSSLTLLQVPTVAKVKITKISKDTSIEEKDTNEPPEREINNLSNLKDDEFSWNTNDMFEEKEGNITSNIYIINYTFPILNNKMECIGIGNSKNTYTINSGVNSCSTHTEFSFYDKPEKYLKNECGPNIKYHKKEDIKIVGYFNTNVNYQGLRDNSKFLVGETITDIKEYEGKIENDLYSNQEETPPTSISIIGYADGSRRAKILL